MRVEWDPNKARANLLKHGISFEEAGTVLCDRMSVTGADPDHSVDEARYVTVGMSKRGRLIILSHTDGDEAVRIISARSATKKERKLYEESQK